MGSTSSKDIHKSKQSKLENHLHEAISLRFKTMTDGKPVLSLDAFKKFSSRYLDSNFQDIVFQTFKKFRKDDKVNCENVLRFADLLFGDNDQLASCIVLFDLKLRSFVEASVASLFICEYSTEHPPGNLLVDFIMTYAPKEDDGLNLTLLSKWLSQSTLLPSILVRVFKVLLVGDDERLIPNLENQTILSPSALFAISSQLPAENRYQWALLYSSQTHGESFSKLLNAVNGTGPSLIVIESDKGKIFGGFANDGFVCGPQYTGDSRCFLFQDRPKLAIYGATSFNSDFAYLNYQQTSFPNGLGMGGRDDHWSFFLHGEFGLGTSSPSISTFEKCWLAGETRFKVRSVEAWRIGREVKRKRYDSAGNELIEDEISALDRDPEARAILELAGKKTHGDAFRELPQEK